MSIKHLKQGLMFILYGIFLFYSAACSQPQGYTTQEMEQNPTSVSLRPTNNPQPQVTVETPQVDWTATVQPVRSPELTVTPSVRVAITQTSSPGYFPSIMDSAIIPSQDIIFLSAGVLHVWSRTTGEIAPLIQERAATGTPALDASGAMKNRVAEYSVDRKNRRIVMLRSRGISANGVELFDLEILDLATGEIKALLQETPAIYNLGVSPDGYWVTYTFLPRGIGPIFSIQTEKGGEPLIIGECKAETELDCGEIVWLNEQTSVMWNDREGVWLSSAPEFKPLKIIGNQVQIIDLEGKEITLEVSFDDLSWSPQGRYILARIKPLRSEVRWQAIIDTLRARVVEIPGTYEYDETAAIAGWLPDGKLIVIQNQSGETAHTFRVALYEVLPASVDLLVEEQEFVVDLSAHLPREIAQKKDMELSPQYLLAESERKIWANFSSTVEGVFAGLYQIDRKFRMVTRGYDLPEGEILYFWSPGSLEAILEIPPDRLYYFRPEVQSVYDIEPWLGSGSCCFQWIP